MTAGPDTGWMRHVPPRSGACSMDLFHAMASLCGNGPFELPPEASRLREEIGEARHYLFILLDGLGTNLRDYYPKRGFFNSHFHRELRAMFPSTTTSVLVSLATGLWPAEHGIIGWFTHLPAAGFTSVPLLFNERFTSTPLSDLGFDVHDVFPFQRRTDGYGRTVRFLSHLSLIHI